MFPLSIATYVRIGILASIFVVGLFLGWNYEHRALVAYKAEVQAQAQKQIAENESKAKQQELINRGIANEYQAKLSALKSYYGGLRQPGSGSMPSLSNPASGVNESTSNQLLACAYTTQQLVSLQDWINQQIGLSDK